MFQTHAPSKFGNGEHFYPTLYNGYNYLSMPGLTLSHVSKRAFSENLSDLSNSIVDKWQEIWKYCYVALTKFGKTKGRLFEVKRYTDWIWNANKTCQRMHYQLLLVLSCDSFQSCAQQPTKIVKSATQGWSHICAKSARDLWKFILKPRSVKKVRTKMVTKG